MCPAEVICTDGYKFVVPAGHVLDNRVSGFERMSEEDQRDARDWKAIFGTNDGYKVNVPGKVGLTIEVTPTSVVSNPQGYENHITLESGNIYRLKGGTQIAPIGKTE